MVCKKNEACRVVETTKLCKETYGNVPGTCATLGFIVGLVLASILMSTIASAVNTVIVCFAEGPAEFEANHPELSRKMRDTWLQFYPSCGAWGYWGCDICSLLASGVVNGGRYRGFIHNEMFRLLFFVLICQRWGCWIELHSIITNRENYVCIKLEFCTIKRSWLDIFIYSPNLPPNPPPLQKELPVPPTYVSLKLPMPHTDASSSLAYYILRIRLSVPSGHLGYDSRVSQVFSSLEWGHQILEAIISPPFIHLFDRLIDPVRPSSSFLPTSAGLYWTTC